MNGRQTFYFDGACRPNPGRMEAAVVHRGRTHYFSNLGDGDSTEAEWLALLMAARLAADSGAGDVLLIGDAAAVIEQARGRWPCRVPRVQHHLSTFRDVTSGIARVTVRGVPRSKNLAGIMLARRGMLTIVAGRERT